MPTFQPKDRTIKLIVQANKLYHSGVSEENLDDYTSLVEDGGLSSTYGQPNKDFETIVYMTKNICWSIEMADPNGDDKDYNVSLISVIHKPKTGNPNFFTNDPLLVNSKTGKVCGIIAIDPNLPEKDDSYTIEFGIGYTDPSGSGGGMLKVDLDPKLRIRTRN